MPLSLKELENQLIDGFLKWWIFENLIKLREEFISRDISRKMWAQLKTALEVCFLQESRS